MDTIADAGINWRAGHGKRAAAGRNAPRTPPKIVPLSVEGIRLMTPKKLFKIGEVMRYTGLSRQTLHNYTMLGLIREEERTESGHRLYGAEVFKKLGRIIELKKADKTLRDIQDIMSKKAAFS